MLGSLPRLPLELSLKLGGGEPTELARIVLFVTLTDRLRSNFGGIAIGSCVRERGRPLGPGSNESGESDKVGSLISSEAI